MNIFTGFQMPRSSFNESTNIHSLLYYKCSASIITKIILFKIKYVEIESENQRSIFHGNKITWFPPGNYVDFMIIW